MYPDPAFVDHSIAYIFFGSSRPKKNMGRDKPRLGENESWGRGRYM